MGIPSVLPTNPLVARPLPLLIIHLLHHYSFCDKTPFCLFLLYTSTSRFKWIRIRLLHYLALWHASDGLNHLLLLLGKIPSQQDIFPKRSYGRKPKIDPLFPPPPNHALWIPLTMGPPPWYWLGTGWWCPGPFVFALLSSVFVCHAVPAVAD